MLVNKQLVISCKLLCSYMHTLQTIASFTETFSGAVISQYSGTSE